MADELSEKEAAALFNQVSKGIQDGDSLKLSTLMDTEAPENKEPVVETKPATEVEETKEPEEKESTETKEDDKSSDEKTPPEKAEKVEQEKATPTELDLLKEQVERLAKENHGLKSQWGRAKDIPRKIKEIDKRLEELAKASAAPSSQLSTKVEPKVDELLKGIKETDPDLANTIAAAIKEATKGVAEDSQAKEKQTLEFLRSQEYQTYQENESGRLLEMYPNAVEVFKSPAWSEWRAKQSPRVVGLADSDNADDVSFAFQKYAADMIAEHPELAKAKAEEQTPASANNTQAEAAKKIEAERQRKKETTVNVGSPNVAAKTSMPDDATALFKKYVAEIATRQSGR